MDRVGAGGKVASLVHGGVLGTAPAARAWPFGGTLVGIGGRPMGARMDTSRAEKDRVSGRVSESGG